MRTFIAAFVASTAIVCSLSSTAFADPTVRIPAGASATGQRALTRLASQRFAQTDNDAAGKKPATTVAGLIAHNELAETLADSGTRGHMPKMDSKASGGKRVGLPFLGVSTKKTPIKNEQGQVVGQETRKVVRVFTKGTEIKKLTKNDDGVQTNRDSKYAYRWVGPSNTKWTHTADLSHKADDVEVQSKTTASGGDNPGVRANEPAGLHAEGKNTTQVKVSKGVVNSAEAKGSGSWTNGTAVQVTEK
jgi:hypothetical protein